MGAWAVFVVLGTMLVTSGIMVVRAEDLVRAVLWLALTLITTAGLYVSLYADFIAAVQILLYTGGVITLMLFAVMLTRRFTSARILIRSGGHLRGVLAAAGVLGLVGVAIMRTGRSTAPAPEMVVDTRALGAMFLTDFILPFEVLSLLLLAAMIGAIVLARKTDP